MKKSILATALVATSGSVLADDSAVTAAINSAVSSGQSNYGLVVVGLIGLAALGFGLRMITGAMR
ncbi:hypothetical protein [Vibrio mediterranei]|uniref:Phage coat protein n=1 Tax=Vibrio mediterranei TaxID=689 RepID=A0A3G4V544_9VIBR|nr:hypothetical protein [Vibrio mediterranei]AYV19810.1 hypothetical protein ECB94_00225 [Vibrio mediterranei]AYV19818.1 hypothetical protein ECB94_00270 [Vibrio mediterranei]NOH31662.1 hypothetical protein [Vibrio mediterranei]NOI26351.1 hypothetical protein [Vibrio mediterranei]